MKVVISTAEKETHGLLLIAVIPLESFYTNVFGEPHLHKLFNFSGKVFLERIFFHPLLGSVFVQLFVSLVLTSHLGVLRIIGLRLAEQRLQRDEGRPDRERRRPLVLQNVKANRSGL